MELKNGDKVRIREDSEFIRQGGHGIGIIDDGKRLFCVDGWYHVNFLDGYSNSYRGRDLELVKNGKPQIYGIALFIERLNKK